MGSTDAVGPLRALQCLEGAYHEQLDPPRRRASFSKHIRLKEGIPSQVKTVELRMNEKQRMIALLYLARRASAAQLLAALEGCEEMSLLRLEESKAG
jgi:hypothetical protein